MVRVCVVTDERLGVDKSDPTVFQALCDLAGAHCHGIDPYEAFG